MKRAAIVSPIRTAVGKYLGALSDMPAGELQSVRVLDSGGRVRYEMTFDN